MVLLLKGDMATVFDKYKRSGHVGWSYENVSVAILFAAVLIVSIGARLDEAPVVRSILKRYTRVRPEDSISFYNRDARNDDEGSDGIDYYLSDEIAKSLSNVILPDDEKKTYLGWGFSKGRKRIEHIIDNKHRTAYGRAAEVLCALAETCVLTGEIKRAFELVRGYRDEKYKRHPAFKRELTAALKRSPILKSVC
jgi:hypothetical protein